MKKAVELTARFSQRETEKNLALCLGAEIWRDSKQRLFAVFPGREVPEVLKNNKTIDILYIPETWDKIE